LYVKYHDQSFGVNVVGWLRCVALSLVRSAVGGPRPLVKDALKSAIMVDDWINGTVADAMRVGLGNRCRLAGALRKD
jgi:hypothetical protein